jgi:hypothetical protein
MFSHVFRQNNKCVYFFSRTKKTLSKKMKFLHFLLPLLSVLFIATSSTTAQTTTTPSDQSNSTTTEAPSSPIAFPERNVLLVVLALVGWLALMAGAIYLWKKNSVRKLDAEKARQQEQEEADLRERRGKNSTEEFKSNESEVGFLASHHEREQDKMAMSGSFMRLTPPELDKELQKNNNNNNSGGTFAVQINQNGNNNNNNQSVGGLYRQLDEPSPVRNHKLHNLGIAEADEMDEMTYL